MVVYGYFKGILSVLGHTFQRIPLKKLFFYANQQNIDKPF